MKRVAWFLSAALVFAAAPAAAQAGFALKGSLVFNSNEVDTDQERSHLSISDAAGFNVGVEYILAGGLGLGLSGFTVGSPDNFDVGEGSLVMIGEANYFFNVPGLPISPYAGLHVGLGRYDLDDFRDRARPEVDFGDRGWQIGLRFQPTSLIGLDAQYRRVSGSVADEQDITFENNQVLVGVTLF